MDTDKHRLFKSRKTFLDSRIHRIVFAASVFIGVYRWQTDFAFAGQATPVVDNALDAAAKALDKSKEEVQRLKDSWDKTRLETTLYDQRAKRAYQRWIKAAKSAKDRAKEQKEKAELELQLAIEKRKLAYSQWQAAVYRGMAKESELKALDQDKDTKAIQDKIKELETKIGPRSAVLSP